MPSDRRCVFGCATTGVTIHSFPNPLKFPERFKLWVDLVGDSMRGISDEEIFTIKKICDRHFIAKHKNRNNRLNALAVPVEHMSKGAISVPERELFSWESEPTGIQQDEEEQCDDVPDNLSMHCDGGDTANEINDRHEGFHCDGCNGEIVGFRYTCVQCSNLDLCISCESSGAHAHHYMLRIPGPRPYNEIQTVLTRIRRYLLSNLDPISVCDLDNDDAISLKSEIKSEIEDEDISEVQDIEDTPAVDMEKNTTSNESPQHDKSVREQLKKDELIRSTIQQQVKIHDASGMKQKYRQIPIVKLHKDEIHSSVYQRLNISSPNSQEQERKHRLVPVIKLHKDEIIHSSVQQQLNISNSNSKEQERKHRLVPIVKLKKDELIDSGVQQQVSICDASAKGHQKSILLSKLNKKELVPGPIQQPVEILKIKQNINQSSSIRMADENKSTTSPSAAKRKIILSLAEYIKLKESNQIAKKICVKPSTSKQETKKTTKL